MATKPSTSRALSRFLAGCLAPMLVAGGVLAWRGDLVLARMQTLEPSSTVIAILAFVITLVVPCGVLALPGAGAGLTSRFARCLVPPLAILAAGSICRMDEKSCPTGDGRGVVSRSVMLVWTPLTVRTAEEPRPVAPAPKTPAGESRDDLHRQIRDLERECEAAHDALEARGASGTPALERTVEEQRRRIESLESAQGVAEAAAKRTIAAAAKSAERKIKANEAVLLTARREGDDLRAEILILKEKVQMAGDDAALAERKLVARIDELEASGSQAALKTLRANSFVRVGVVFDIEDQMAGGGLRVKTSVDASKITGLAFVLDPRGKPICVISCGVGRGNIVGARILFRAPASKPTPGDSVYARVR
jgi:hypothetical protein